MFLRNIDMLSPTITLYYKQNETHASIISGILTIIAYTLIFIYGFLYSLNFINREDPIAYYFNRYVEDIGTFSFNDSYFFHYIQLIRSGSRETIDIDFNKIEIIGINRSLEYYMKNGKNITHWIYGKCDEEININDINYLLNNETFMKSACIKKFYNSEKKKYFYIYEEGFEWPVIKHGASNVNITYYGTVIQKCSNSSGNNCSSEEEINSYLYDVYLSFNIIDYYVDVLNYKNPISKFLYSITTRLTDDSYIINNLNFNPGLLKSYDNLFRAKSIERLVYFFHENSKTTTYLENTNILSVFFIYMQNTQLYYERRYQGFQDALSVIGGYGSIMITLASCINYLIARSNMLIDTQLLLTNIIEKNISVYENIVKNQGIKRLINQNINLNNNNELNIKIFDPNNNNTNNLMNNRKISEDKKSEDKKIISKRINVIKNNIGEETNRNNNVNNSEQNVIIEQKKSEGFEKLKRMSTRNNIKRDFALINKKDSFNCFDYFFYIIACKQINSKIKYYEELRRLIISEECMIQNYLNIYKLLEVHNFN